MAQPYVGELRMFAGNFAPLGWQFCDGSLLSISENETLFQLIGTTYGGDGESTFAVPDLRGRIPLHQGNGFSLAETGGVETITLTASQIPSHSHTVQATNAVANKTSPTGNHLATIGSNFLYLADAVTDDTSSTIASAGGSQAHSNMQPYLCLSLIISLFGIFPSQT
jgi:microcystin-dependent protein